MGQAFEGERTDMKKIELPGPRRE